MITGCCHTWAKERGSETRCRGRFTGTQNRRPMSLLMKLVGWRGSMPAFHCCRRSCRHNPDLLPSRLQHHRQQALIPGCDCGTKNLLGEQCQRTSEFESQRSSGSGGEFCPASIAKSGSTFAPEIASRVLSSELATGRCYKRPTFSLSHSQVAKVELTVNRNGAERDEMLTAVIEQLNSNLSDLHPYFFGSA